MIFAVDSPSTIVFAFFLCASAAGLVFWHIRAWRQARETEMDARERDFFRRQFRRRMQTSVMLGVLGVAIGVGQRLLLSGGVSQSAALVYWCCVVGLVLWLLLLALADITATSFHYAREKNQYLADRARLQGEIQRVKAEEGEKGGYPLAGEREGERD